MTGKPYATTRAALEGLRDGSDAELVMRVAGSGALELATAEFDEETTLLLVAELDALGAVPR